MNEQKPIIVPEEIECSSGSVFSFNYKRVVYSLTMQPDKILIQQAIRLLLKEQVKLLCLIL